MGGVVMGADSRVSTGTYIANRVSDKVSALHDKIFMCRSGSAADTQAVSDYVRHYLASHAIEVGAPPLVKTAASGGRHRRGLRRGRRRLGLRHSPRRDVPQGAL